MKKMLTLMMTLLMVLGFSAAAMAYSTAGQYDVVIWWDTDGDLSTTETSVTLGVGDTLNASLYVSGIDSGYAWNDFDAALTWADAAFDSETVTVDSTFWDLTAPGLTESGPGSWWIDGQPSYLGTPRVAGNDIKLLDVVFTNYSGLATVLNTEGDGDILGGFGHWSAYAANNFPEGATFEVQDLNISTEPEPQPGAPINVAAIQLLLLSD
jgi:hypothetical protein